MIPAFLSDYAPLIRPTDRPPSCRNTHTSMVIPNEVRNLHFPLFVIPDLIRKPASLFFPFVLSVAQRSRRTCPDLIRDPASFPSFTPLRHPRRLSPTFLIGDPGNYRIQCLCFFFCSRRARHWVPAFAGTTQRGIRDPASFPSFAPLRHPRLDQGSSVFVFFCPTPSSSTFLIEDPVSLFLPS